MFLVDTSRANREWDDIVKHVHGLIARHGGQVTKSEKWAERRLAYPILGRKRATYILVHFEGEGAGLAALQRDCQLSDVVLRVLIIRDEKRAAPPSAADEAAGPVVETAGTPDAEAPAEPQPQAEAAPDADEAGPDAETPSDAAADADAEEPAPEAEAPDAPAPEPDAPDPDAEADAGDADAEEKTEDS